MTFRVESEFAEIYEWDFGDGFTNIVSEDLVKHTYKKSGEQEVTLVIRGEGGESNTTTFPVYVVDTNQPYAIIGVGIGEADLYLEDTMCDGHPAYLADRVSPVTFR